MENMVERFNAAFDESFNEKKDRSADTPMHPDVSWVAGGDYFDDKVDVEHHLAAGTQDWHEKVVLALRSVHDPEIPLNIYDLGLVYKVETLNEGYVRVTMTLTSPSCPEAESIPIRVETNLKELSDTVRVEVEIVWDPPWDADRMSEEGRLELGLY